MALPPSVPGRLLQDPACDCEAESQSATPIESEGHIVLEDDSIMGYDVSKQIEELENEFRNLFSEANEELKEVEPFKLIDCLVLLPVQLKKEYQSDISKILPDLRREESSRVVLIQIGDLFSFIEPALLGHIVLSFGSDLLKHKFKDYCEKLERFTKRTTVHHLLTYWPGDLLSSFEFELLKTKLKSPPDQYTLEDLDKLRKRFCCEMKLSTLISNVIGSLGSVKVNESIAFSDSGMPTKDQAKVELTASQSPEIQIATKRQAGDTIVSEDVGVMPEPLSAHHETIVRANEARLLAKSFKTLIPIAQMWRNIGTMLELSQKDLESIAAHEDDVISCLREMLRLWWSQIDNPSVAWQTIAEAVEIFDARTAAELKFHMLSI